MPAHVWDGSTWVETIARTWVGADWTDDDDNLWAWDGSTWRLIQPVAGVGDIELLPVENLTADTVTHHALEASWDLPAQPEQDPTEVWVRIVEHGDVWLVFDYPQTVFAHNALDGDTAYQLQVKLVLRELGEVTAESPIRSVFFTTDPAPMGPPAPDPGGSGGDTIFPIIPIPGGGGGPVGGPGCWWVWELFIISQTTLAWITTGITGEWDGDVDEFEYDIDTLDPTRVYRFHFETDPGCAEPQEFDGPAFNGGGDWEADCGEIPASSSAALAVVADAVWAMPEICTDGDGQGIFDRVSGTRLVEGPHFRAWFTDLDGEQGVICDDDGGQVWSVGLAAIGDTLVAGQDFVILKHWRNPDLLPEVGEFAEDVFGTAHNLRRVITATGWSYKANFYGENGQITLQSAEFPFDNEWHAVLIHWDDDGDKMLFVDDPGTPVDTDSSGDSIDTAMLISSSYIAGLPGGAQTRMHIGWDRLLSEAERRTVMFGDPTGGDIQDIGDYRYHFITEDDVFSPQGSLEIEWVAIGAGGASGGGQAFVNHQSGGGGGECRHGTTTISTPQAVTIGVGGLYLNAANNGTDGEDGGDTIFGTVGTAPGGKGAPSKTGGSSGNDVQANGAGTGVSGGVGSGGGAGAGDHTVGAGTAAGFGSQSQAGGGYDAFGLGTYYGGGGSGIPQSGAQQPGTLGRNNGTNPDGLDGIPNTGQGGYSGGGGGSGIVIVRYLIPV